MGFGATRSEARQLVSHKAILVNGKVVNIPSYTVKAEDVITVREKAKKQARIIAALELAGQRIAVVRVDDAAGAAVGGVVALRPRQDALGVGLRAARVDLTGGVGAGRGPTARRSGRGIPGGPAGWA